MTTAVADVSARPARPRRPGRGPGSLTYTNLNRGSALALGLAVTWFSVLVLIPLAAVVVTASGGGWDAYVTTLTNPQTWAAIKLTVGASLALWALGMTPVYGLTALVVGALLLIEAHRLHGRARRGEPVKPMRLFHWSTTYLSILSVAISVDALIR